jgi:hypothetical protein
MHEKKSNNFTRIRDLFKSKKKEVKKTMAIKHTIRPEDYSDAFDITPLPKMQGVEVYDMTKKEGDYFIDYLKLRKRFGSERHMQFATEADRRMTAVEEKQRLIEQERRVKAEAEKISANTPFNRFVHAVKLKNHSIDDLTTWTNGTSTAEKISVLQEFQRLKNSRGLPLSDELIDFGLSYLMEHIRGKL